MLISGLVPGRKDRHLKAATQIRIMTGANKERELEIDRMQLSDQALDLVAMRFRSLGEPTRLKILRLLEGGEMSVGELVRQLECSQANISKHLKVLVEAGVLSRRVEGTSALYAISDPIILRVCDTVCRGMADNLRSQVEGFGYKLSRKRSTR